MKKKEELGKEEELKEDEELEELMKKNSTESFTLS